MFPLRSLAITVGVLAIVSPRHAVEAQSGQALVLAEYACVQSGIAPHTPAFERCVRRAADAFDRGETDLADQRDRSTSAARATCLSHGLPADTPGYRQCVALQVDQDR